MSDWDRPLDMWWRHEYHGANLEVHQMKELLGHGMFSPWADGPTRRPVEQPRLAARPEPLFKNMGDPVDLEPT